MRQSQAENTHQQRGTGSYQKRHMGCFHAQFADDQSNDHPANGSEDSNEREVFSWIFNLAKGDGVG